MSTIPRIALVLTVLAACGGGGESSSGPLAKHFDEMYVARVDMSQTQPMQTAQNAWQVARLENSHAESDLSEASLQLQLAKNEVKGAKLKEDSARAEKKSADASADQNQINQAMRALRGAEKFRKAGELRVKYLDAYRNYLKGQVQFSQENMYWHEAQYEVEKAKLAKSNNIAPKGFAYDDYVRQEQQRSSKTNSARDHALKGKQKALDARSQWLSVQGEADTMIGVKNQLPDPMAPKPIQGNDMTKGGGGITIGNGAGSSSPQ